MITQEKFHKLCKYSLRLQKSFISNNSNNYAKYCSHLKYHIGGQIGSGSNLELDRLFDILTKYINENNDVYNITDIEKKFADEKKQLEANIELYKIKIQENEDKVEKLNLQMIETKNKLEKNNLELDETTKKLNSQILDTKNELMETKNKLEEANLEFMETKNKLEEANTNEYVVKKLKELHKTKYEEFVDLLEKLFTQVYNEEIASNIIEEIGQGETWKDNEVEKTKRMETKVNVNGKELTWNEIIEVIKILNTYGSAQLIKDIEKYLETGEGDVEKLISRYKAELSESTQKLGLNTKPKQTKFTGNTTIPIPNITGQNSNGTFRTKWINKPI